MKCLPFVRIFLFLFKCLNHSFTLLLYCPALYIYVLVCILAFKIEVDLGNEHSLSSLLFWRQW